MARSLARLARLLLTGSAAIAAVAVPRLGAQDLTCDRGDREVRGVRFVGAQEFSAATLAATVVTVPSSVAGLPVLGERRCLDPVEFARDVQRLLTLYRRRGFPEVQVDTQVTTTRPGRLVVTFVIREGLPVRVAALALRGVDAHPELPALVRDFPLRVGGVFDRGALEAGRDTLARRLRNLGWPQAEVVLAYAVKTALRTAEVEVTVVPGTRARLGRIALHVDTTGQRPRHVTDATIQRAMALTPGDWYSARAIIEAQRNVYQTDAFQRVDVQPDSVQPPGDSIVNLVATLVEADRWVARGGLGWATLDCFRAQGALTDRDFLPRMERLELTARVSKIGIGAPLDGAPSLCQGQARADPYSATLNYYTSMTVGPAIRRPGERLPTITLFSSALSEYKAYLRRTPIGGSVAWSRPFARRVPGTLSYQLELGRTDAEPAFFCAVFNACDADARRFLQRNNRLAALEYAAAWTRTDDPIRPTRTTTVRVNLRHASTLIGSDATQQFNRATGDATWTGTLGPQLTLTAHVRGGLVLGGSTTPTLRSFVPPQERLYAGGPTTVRGFRQNELGPAVYIVSGYRTVFEQGATYFRADSTVVTERVVPAGGNTLVVANLELQGPSPFAPRLLQWALFTDAGRLWDRGSRGAVTLTTDDGPLIKVTPGVGVRIVSPFGAIRIDLGYNPYRLPSGAAYFNAPLQAGSAPLYCVSPTNQLPVQAGSGAGAPPVQAAGSCPASFRPGRSDSFLRRLNPSIWIGQAF